MNAARRGRWVAALVLALGFAGCATTASRPPTGAEIGPLHAALLRLWPGEVPECLSVRIVNQRGVGGFAWSTPGPGCGVVELTAGTLAAGEAEFRAVFAHELAHVLLGHTWSWKSRRQAQAEEAAADRLGAMLLLAGYGRAGCLALARFYEGYLQRAPTWSSPDHPPLGERVRIVQGVCR